MGCGQTKDMVTFAETSSHRYVDQTLEVSLSDGKERADSLVGHGRSQAFCDTVGASSRRTTAITRCSRNSSSSSTGISCTTWRAKVLSGVSAGCHTAVRQMMDQWPPGHYQRHVWEDVVGQCRKEEELVALIRDAGHLPLPAEDFAQDDAPHAIRARCNFLKALRALRQEAAHPSSLDAPVASSSSFALGSLAPATSMATDEAPLPVTSSTPKTRESQCSVTSTSASGSSRDQSSASPSALSEVSTLARPLTDRPVDEVPHVTAGPPVTPPKALPKVGSFGESDDLDNFEGVDIRTGKPFLVKVPSVAI